jgi:hypothetical protein
MSTHSRTSYVSLDVAVRRGAPIMQPVVSGTGADAERLAASDYGDRHGPDDCAGWTKR